jgi:hypothetical protein
MRAGAAADNRVHTATILFLPDRRPLTVPANTPREAGVVAWVEAVLEVLPILLCQHAAMHAVKRFAIKEWSNVLILGDAGSVGLLLLVRHERPA